MISQFTDTKPVAVFRLDVSTVYNEKDHVFERKWAQLINPEAVESSCGYLLLSIAVGERGVKTKVKVIKMFLTRLLKYFSLTEYSWRSK